MGWAFCGSDDQGRPIGYGVPATCDEPGCTTEIDRGLSYVCGSMHGGGEYGCGRYFCGKHLHHARVRGDGPDDPDRHYESLCRACNKAWAEANPAAADE
jgi:hypothetical protein